MQFRFTLADMFSVRALGILIVTVAIFSAGMALASTPLVTGNGFGFAVVSPQTGALTKFYAHPYSFMRPDPKDPLSEGIETANFIKNLSWSEEKDQPSVIYVDDSHVIRTSGTSGEGTFFLPFGLDCNALIVEWQPRPETNPGHFEVQWNHRITSHKVFRKYGIEMQVIGFEGIEESLLLIPLGRPMAAAGSDQYLSTNSSWAIISLESGTKFQDIARDFHGWRAGLPPSALAHREIEQLNHWRAKTPSNLDDKELHLWRQSEILLRMAQNREPNRPGRYGNGLIVACLPDGSWFMTWARDMAYGALALSRMGHKDEARAALLAYFNARPTGKMKELTGGLDYQVSVVRYFGDGSEEPFFTNEGSTNIEFDNWGLVLYVLGDYLRRYDDPTLLKEMTYRGPLYESARDYIAKPLLAATEKYDDGLIVTADTSIWEERQKDKKHFAYSSALAIVGLREFADDARQAGDQATRKDALDHVALLEKGFRAAFIRDGKLHGTLEEGVKNDIDGALLAVINLGVVTDPAIVRSTVERMELLKVVSGGYRRVRSTYTDPSIYEYWYERQEFLFVDFMLAQVYRNLGQQDEANAILKRIVDKASADHNFIPEMYVAVDCKLFHGAVGDPTGAIPMVGYGAGVYVLDVLQRTGMERTH
ncbi:MAG: glycoside hydrolase family 15 protein [Acidobacteriaceae bacterium]